jgi:hypothetical protein
LAPARVARTARVRRGNVPSSPVMLGALFARPDAAQERARGGPFADRDRPRRCSGRSRACCGCRGRDSGCLKAHLRACSADSAANSQADASKARVCYLAVVPLPCEEALRAVFELSTAIGRPARTTTSSTAAHGPQRATLPPSGLKAATSYRRRGRWTWDDADAAAEVPVSRAPDDDDGRGSARDPQRLPRSATGDDEPGRQEAAGPRTPATAGEARGPAETVRGHCRRRPLSEEWHCTTRPHADEEAHMT